LFLGGAIMFPKKTILGKKLPKQRFYEKIEIKPSLKKKFVDWIESITFANKFSPETLNLAKAGDVEEIFVFDIKLKEIKYLDKIEDVLSLIDKSVPYPILYQFNLGKKIVYKIAYKKRNINDINKSIIDVYLTKEITNLDEFSKEFNKVFNALNMKILYENIIKLFLHKEEESVEESVEKEKNYLSLKDELEKLEQMVIKEKQADRQYEIHNRIKQLKMELENE